jgi:zinc protease
MKTDLAAQQRRNSPRAALLTTVLAGLLLWLLSPGALRAGTPGVDEPPPAQAPRPMVLPTLHRTTLANGLTLVVAPRPGLPVVTVSLLVRAGPETDATGRPGVAAMTATLWPKGALRGGKSVSAAELARAAEALGGSLDSSSSWGASSLSMTVSSPRLDEAAALLADVMRHPLLAADELGRARAQALDGLRVTLGNPAEVAALALRRGFWGMGPYGQSALPPALQSLSRADLQAFQATWVRPELVALLLVGDVTPEQGQALAQQLLGDWRAPAQPLPVLEPAAPAPISAALVLIDMPGSGQSGVAVAAPYISSAPADRPQRYAALVANAVLGGGYSARLNQEVRIKRGLSYGAASSAESQPSGGMFSASAQTNHPSAAEVLTLLRGEITRLSDNPPSADELAARQAALLGSFARRLETTAGLSAVLLGQLAQGRPLSELAAYGPGLLAVTPAQVQAFARQHWQAAGLRAVIAGDLAAGGASLAALAAAAPAVLQLPVAELDLAQDSLRKPSTR